MSCPRRRGSRAPVNRLKRQTPMSRRSICPGKSPAHRTGLRATRTGGGSEMQLAKTSYPSANTIFNVLTDFTKWLDGYGETSWDHQSFFAGQSVVGQGALLQGKMRNGGGRSDDFLRGVPAISPAAVSSSDPISDCRRPLCDGIRFLYEADWRLTSTSGTRNSLFWMS